jgi:hypothetical protein
VKIIFRTAPDHVSKGKGQNPLHLATLWYDKRKMRRRLSNEEKGVFKNSSPLGKNAKPVGTIIGYFAKSHTEF